VPVLAGVFNGAALPLLAPPLTLLDHT
jgi:hypothetical protein